jgi:DNA-binding transcriptional LysR family regulator
MNLHDVQAFVAIAESGSINRASHRLNITQPAVTRRLQGFEAALGGAALLDRSVKPPTLTPLGREVLEGCRKVLKAVAELKASSTPGEPAGQLSIGVAHGLAEIALSSPLDDLRQRFPALRLRVIANWTNWLIQEVRAGSLDCAVALLDDSHVAPAGVYATAMGAEKLVVAAPRSARRLLARKTPKLGDLAGYPWILNPAGCGYRAAVQRAFDRSKVPLDIAAEVSGHPLQLSLAARGVGLTIVPRRMLEASPYRRQLQIVKIDDFSHQATISLLHGPSLGRLAEPVELLRSRTADALLGERG